MFAFLDQKLQQSLSSDIFIHRTSTKTRVCVIEALCSLQKSITQWRDHGHSGQDTGKKLQHSSCTGKYDTVSTVRNITTAIITAKKKHGKSGRETDHHQALRLAMCTYKIVILLKNESSLYVSPLVSSQVLFAQHFS